MERLIEKLKNNNKTISTMESCTGGALASAITDIEGASDVIKFSCVTYCNEYKIKMGVSKDVIDKYSVYSFETANEMSFNVSKFSNSSYGVGITGKLNRFDKNNLYGEDNIVFISIYDSESKEFYTEKIKAVKSSRKENKKLVVEKVVSLLSCIINEK